ncbi:MAG: outer membrane beta-barrel protein [Bacteroidales bacterium]|nr:outer membrane beta-barrel protein [Bacteroidales bacterium]
MLRFSVIHFLILLLLATSVTAQRYHKNDDIGIIVGGSTYEGDINFGSLFHNPQFAVGLIYRKNFSPHYSLRLGVTGTQLSAADSDLGGDFQKLRNQAFAKSIIVDISGLVEFNFLELTTDKKKFNFTPFVATGLTFFGNNYTPKLLNFAIPLGFGFKYKFAPKWTLQLEWIYRFTFTDNLDNLILISEVRDYYNKQYSFDYTNDIYSIFGVSLLYQIRKKAPECPGYK